jgi:hypothetical protein
VLVFSVLGYYKVIPPKALYGLKKEYHYQMSGDEHMKFNVKKVETVSTTAMAIIDDAGGPWMESKKQCL